MSRMLTDEELARWNKSRADEAERCRTELFTEPTKDIQLSEIKIELTAMQAHTCNCNRCLRLRDLIARIEKAEKR